MIFLFALIGWLSAEIAGFILVGGRIGVLATLAAIFATALLGLSLLRRQGGAVSERIRLALSRDEPPVAEVLEGLAIAVAGLCLVLPGFISDLFGLLLFVPGIRRGLFATLVDTLRRRGVVRTWARSGEVVVDADYEDVTPTEAPELRDDRDRRR